MVDTLVIGEFMGLLPFLVTGVEKRSVSLQRVSEGLIIAAITAGITTYGTVKVIETELGHLKENQIMTIAKIDEIAILSRRTADVQNAYLPLREEQMRNIDKRLNALEKHK